jgi:acylphosphatase
MLAPPVYTRSDDPSGEGKRMNATHVRERRTVYYGGSVQGVGFRYAARSISGHHKVTGFVRNLADGRVELVAEGEPRELTPFLAEIRDRLGCHIRDEKCDTQAASGEFSGFEIRH